MRTISIIVMTAVAVCTGVLPAKAAPQLVPGMSALKAQAAAVEDVGYRRGYSRRNGYPLPYAYYGYCPPRAYWYYVPEYPRYAPYLSRYY